MAKVDLDKSEYTAAELRQINREVAEALGLAYTKHRYGITLDGPMAEYLSARAMPKFRPAETNVWINTILNALLAFDDVMVIFRREYSPAWGLLESVTVREHHGGVATSYDGEAPTRALALSLAVCRWGRAKEGR